tara:strand:- start:138 stop:323 length:186 start_codon:yes stop_codon:yes gene_type:complete
MKIIGVGKMKKRELRMMLDTVINEQEKQKKEIRMLRFALEEFRYKQSLKENISEFQVMNFE